MFHEGKFLQQHIQIVPEYHRKVKACYSNKSCRNVCHGNSYLEQNVSDSFHLWNFRNFPTFLDTIRITYEIAYYKKLCHKVGIFKIVSHDVIPCNMDHKIVLNVIDPELNNCRAAFYLELVLQNFDSPKFHLQVLL